MPIGMTINGQGKVRWAFCYKQPGRLEHGVILLQDNATPHCHRDVQNLVQCLDWEVLVHPPYSPDLTPCDYRLFACENILNRRWYQCRCHCLFTSSEQGWIHTCNWLFTTYMGKICGQCWWLHWVEDTCVNIQEYELYCYLVFCYYNKNIHKTSEITYIDTYKR